MCVCATKEEAAATCTGGCACVDNKDASFIKEDGKQGICVNITLLGFGKPGNGTRIKFYNKDTEVKSTYPGTCKGWC